MAKNKETVWNFINDLREKLLPYGIIYINNIKIYYIFFIMLFYRIKRIINLVRIEKKRL